MSPPKHLFFLRDTGNTLVCKHCGATLPIHRYLTAANESERVSLQNGCPGPADPRLP